ncbi:AraC family transcriptional regulator [Pseudomonas entomophila]|jgi:AraC-like DNA-binding protein|uniref:AraC family transcriptional regulator n=1 Tax=Pseudomonas entomophila TaxID=312306 RepID=UPI0015E45F16|nr:AraC family transcriptional regulator [Pseudomonas entomophila]MBA1194918.1 AraC family transcriptional regulator [Pseudomonas entomophila]
MSDKDTISIHLVREALQQACTAQTPVETLLRAGIDPALLERSTARVSVQSYSSLWRLLARQNDDEFFGMDRRGLRHGSLAFICQASMTQPTLGAGLETLLAFLRLMLADLRPHLVRHAGVAEIVLDEPLASPRRAFTYFTLWMFIHGILCWLAGRRLPILAIDLRCDEPSFCEDYRVMFSENLRFGRTPSRMLIADDCLDTGIRRGAAELKRFLAQAPGNILVKYRDPDSLGRRLRRQLLQREPARWPDADGLARELHLSASTLRRRLAEEGASFQSLKDSVRRELAIAWLDEGRQGMSDLAERLGFADTSSFYKAFRKWFGCNPGQYRALVCSTVSGID